jgi:hypothetical protein
MVLAAGLSGACSGNSTGLNPGAEGGAASGGKSASSSCESDDDCSDETVCRSGACVTACRSDKDCRATDQLCGDDDVCVDCLTDSHCDDGQTCSASGECRGPSSSGGAPNGSGEGGEPNVTPEGGNNTGGTLNEAGMPGVGEAGTGNLPDNCPLEPIDPCAGLPHYTATQTVDGDDSDFCDVPPFTLTLASTPYYRIPKPPIGSTTSATARVAWSATALHVFIRVIDTTPYPNGKSSLLYVWDGDNVEFFASPKTPTGTFSYARSYDYGAFQVIAAPPGGAYFPSGQAAFASTGYATAVPSNQVNVALTANGYTLEAQIPWTEAAPIAGTAMGFDMGLSDDVNGLNADLSTYRDHYGLLYNSSLAVGACTQHYEPYCDSRNWCTPMALP